MFRIIFFLTVVFICIFGLFNLYGIRSDLITKQLIITTLGISIFILLKKMQRHFFRLNAPFFYWSSIILLVITYIVGLEVKGSTRWIDLFFLRFQPSELCKVFFITQLAALFCTFKPHIADRGIFFKSLMYFLIPFMLIYKQPDLGSSLVILSIYAIMLLYSPISKKYLLTIGVVCILMFPLIWMFGLHDYQRGRILSFAGGKTHSTASYNMKQSIIAIGSGNLTGRGLHMGKQSGLAFLPEFHTDFAFASLVEQFGMIGGSLLILLYIALFLMLFVKIYRMTAGRDEVTQFDYYYTLGFSAYVISQTCINIGMNLGMLPIAGITLPFISYGGSSLLALFVGLALLPF